MAEQEAELRAELLALIWGSQFDREHARELVARLPQAPAGLLQAVLAAADRYDRMPARRQQRLRQRVWRATPATVVDNGACPASC